MSDVKIEPVGRWYSMRHSLNVVAIDSLSHNESVQSSSSSDEEEETIFDEEDDTMLKTLNPKDWKDQDHYAVLGLSKLRYRASVDDIKKAYKHKVLKHHPDKRKKLEGTVQVSEDDDYFTCITKAYDILGNPTKRKSYDSVDPQFEDDVPSVNTYSKENFYQVFRDVFKKNSRWSLKPRVPALGGENATFDEVNKFYNFWYNFQSWREFSYLDEEEKEKGENREERRWIEKQNKVERQRSKKEEVARIRQLVDNAYACDPRIKKFKDDEKERKAAEKKAKQDIIKAAEMARKKEKESVLEAERLAKVKRETEEKAKADEAKKEREALKKAMRRERKALRDTCKKYNYFLGEDGDLVKRLEAVETLCQRLDLQSLQKLNAGMTSEDSSKTVFETQLKEVTEQIGQEREKELKRQQELSAGKGATGGGSDSSPWNNEDLQLLIKANNLFPAGTVSRWEVIASFINQHSTSGVTRVAKDVLKKAKNLQKVDMKQMANKNAFEKFEQSVQKTKKADISNPSERSDADLPKAWTSEEQKSLEQALKSYPKDYGADRWDKIAEAVPSRTKKECMKRYKEIVELIKAKKAAQAQAKK
ncbi:dnaJ homolog subfamily C member 2-like [Antedon mediterranea]|uniref:dnaJ homolog subfamily C member 2-like n=1 Tax=Antedon mediterranea TaxID=105859 RepID=UPI003AF9F420